MRIIIILCITACINVLAFGQKDKYLKEVVLKGDYRTNCLDINKNNTKLLIGGEDEKVRVLDLTSRKITFETQAHYQAVVEVRFSTIENGFYTVGDKSFKYWIEGNEKPVKIYTGSLTSITDWDLTPDENYFVAGAFEKKFRHWNKENLKTPLTVETDQSKNVISIAINKENNLIASGSYDKTIELWELDKPQKVLKIDAHAMPVCCLDFANDGSQLISASHDGTAKLWDINTGENLKTYTGHLKAISNIAVSPNGHYLLTASYDNSINIYSIATGDLIYKYKHHKAPVLDIEWNNDGTEFYSCDKEGLILNWLVTKEIFAEYYFGNELNEEVKNNPLFKAKKKGESRSEYNNRQNKADRLYQELLDKYYQKHLKLLTTPLREN